MIGQTLGHYRILQRLGEGGMGVVYKALDTKLNRQVALKLLPPELTSDAERRLRFQREAQTTAALDHPNIATIYEVGEHEGAPYLAMQLVEGTTLRERIGTSPLPFREWLRVAQPIAEALAHAHARRVIHRDLKPDNVMLTTEHQVKILDFGLAKLLDPGPAPRPPRDPAAGAADPHSQMETVSQELSRAGKVFGTVAYMSPEQARGEPADYRSDLFSFGIMLYQMASGRLPFKGRSGVETLHAIIAEEPTPLSQVIPEFPAEAERVVRKAMEKEPERRYQDAADLAADLRNLQRDLDSGKVSATAARSVARAPAQRPVLRRWGIPAGIAIAVAAAAALAAILGYRHLKPAEPGAVAAPPVRKMIVVLPFENLGEAEDAYFADGLTEEITGRLAAVHDLGVISRKSAQQYSKTEKTIRQIGAELGVGYVLEGTVRWARTAGGQPASASRVRVMPQLIRVSDDTHLWTETYDRVMEDIFEVQSEIAGKVIEQLGVTLLEPERRVIESAPTNHPEAYQAYLRGLHHFHQPGYAEEKFTLVSQLLQRAIDLDPTFALAHALLSRAHASLRHHGYDFSSERLAMAEKEAKRALELEPDLGEAHLALGYYYYHGLRDYERALQEFAIAEKRMPNNADLLSAIAYVRRRQGRWEQALQGLQEASRFSPLDPELMLELGLTSMCLRRYEEARQWFERGIALAPDNITLHEYKAKNFLAWTGQTGQARAVLEKMPRAGGDTATRGSTAHLWFWLEMYEGNPSGALKWLKGAPAGMITQSSLDMPHAASLAGHAYLLLGDHDGARREYDAARIVLEKRVATSPDDYAARAALGVAFAGLGRKEDAVREGKRAAETYPLTRDAFAGAQPISNLALIYTMVKEYDAALDQIEHLLSIPGTESARLFRLNPLFEPLRAHPRFRKLTEKYAPAS